MVKYDINIYMKTAVRNIVEPPRINLVSNDYNGNVFDFTIHHDNRTIFDLTDKRVTLIVKSPSGAVIQDFCTVTAPKEGKATITLKKTMFQEAGEYYVELQVYEGQNRATSSPFNYTVRKCLDGDEIVVTNNEFSLIQEALQNVDNANSAANTALSTANSAKAIADDLVPKVEKASTDANTALDRAMNTVSTLDLIENKVVQSGLVSQVSGTTEMSTMNVVNKKGTNFTTDRWITDKIETSTNGGYRVYVKPSRELWVGYATQEKPNVVWRYLRDIKDGDIIITFDTGNRLKIYLNNLDTLLLNTSYIPSDKPISIIHPEIESYIYNRILTLQEIQHNLTVLNNVSAISKLRDHVIATDTYHVETPTGITEEERYTALLKTTCQEFTSAGEAIVVNNGIGKQKVLSGKIEGQTVKNLCPTINTENINYNKSEYVTVNNMIVSISAQNQKFDADINNIMNNLQPDKQYMLKYWVYENTMSLDFELNSHTSGIGAFSTQIKIAAGFKGSKEVLVTAKSDLSNATRFIRTHIPDTQSGKISYSVALFEVGAKTSDNPVPFGLTSTQAVISNNDQKCIFYMPTIDGMTEVMKAAKGTQKWVRIDTKEPRDITTYDYKLVNVMDLGGTRTSYDFVDRVRKVKWVNTAELVLNGTESGWSKYASEFTNVLRFDISALTGGLATDSDKIVCDKFVSAYNDLSDYEHCRNSDASYPAVFVLYINKNRLQSEDVTGLKIWLAENPVTVRYQLAKPIETPMTDEEIAEYDTYRQVIDLGGVEGARNTFEILEDGSAVYTKNSIKRTLFGDEKEKIILNGAISESGYSAFAILICDDLKQQSKRVICDRFDNSTDTGTAGEFVYAGLSLSIKINSSKLTSNDVAGMRAWLSANPTTMIYQLATPIVTHIPKELVSSILTEVKNEIKVDSAVAATNLTVKVPVDRIAAIQTQLDQVTAVLNSPSNLALTANYVEDEYNNLLKQI